MHWENMLSKHWVLIKKRLFITRWWHISPEKLAKIYKNVSSKCWKSEQPEGTFYNLWWTYSKVRKFWLQIDSITENVKDLYIIETRCFFIGTNEYWILLELINIQPRTLFLYIKAAVQKLKSSVIATIEKWIMKMMELVEVAKLTSLVREKILSTFIANWKPLMDFTHETKKGNWWFMVLKNKRMRNGL